MVQSHDFNRDGKIDLAVVCHAQDGQHTTFSKIFYNDGKRFENPKVTQLPTTGPHWMWQEDMGHVYHRRWEQTYRSSMFQWNGPAKGGEVSLHIDRPEGTGLSLAIRSAAIESKLDRQPWQQAHSGNFSLDPKDRCLQYLATFKSDNGDRYPILDRVEITLDTGQ